MARSRKSATDEILLRLRAFGLALPGAHTKSPWPGHLDLAVKDKTFCYLGLEGDPLSISCKLPVSGSSAFLMPHTKPTGYGLGKSGWVTGSFPFGEEPEVEILEAWILESYRAQAPKRLVKELDARTPAGPGQERAVGSRRGTPATVPIEAEAGRVRFYHNPRCGKSRQALALLEARGVPLDVVRYLDEPLRRGELVRLVEALGTTEGLLRRGEAVYRQKYPGIALSQAATISAIMEDPILLERPVAMRGGRAVIGRPPERVLELL